MSSKYVDKEFDDIDEEIDSSEKLYQVKKFYLRRVGLYNYLDFDG